MEMTRLDRLRSWFEGLGKGAILGWEILCSIFTQKLSWRDLIYQIYFLGIKSQSVVLITGAFTGMVLAAQTYYQFHKVKMDTATLAVVGVSMSSELGPVLTGLMVAGRVGAAIAAELGTMRVTEQMDALRTLAAHPVDYLVKPRFLATIIALPLLTSEAIAIGIGAGFFLGSTLLQIDSAYAWYHTVRYTDPSEVMMGIIKSVIFGGIIALVGCYKGINCREGAEGVGKGTTEAVVVSSIAILISNFFLTLVLNKVIVEFSHA